MEDLSDDDADEAQRPVYADITQKASEATLKKRKTTLTLFEAYMAHVRKVHSDNRVYKKVEGTPLDYFDQAYLGAFPTYLMEKKNISKDTAHTYLSNLFSQLRKVHGFSFITKDFISDARMGVSNACFEKEKHGGIAAAMTPRDLYLFCNQLIKENTKHGMMMRAEFVLQYHIMGRVGEASTLQSTCFKYLDEEDEENQARTIAVRFICNIIIPLLFLSTIMCLGYCVSFQKT